MKSVGLKSKRFVIVVWACEKHGKLFRNDEKIVLSLKISYQKSQEEKGKEKKSDSEWIFWCRIRAWWSEKAQPKSLRDKTQRALDEWKMI